MNKKLLNKFAYIALFLVLIGFSIYLLKKANTNEVREQEAYATLNEMKISSDPTFQEFRGEIVDGFPDDFPLLQNAELVGSAITNPAREPDTGYIVKWYLPSDAGVIETVEWYKNELTAQGWETEELDTWENMAELIMHISRDGFEGYVAAEKEGDEIELVADLKVI